MFVVGIVWTGFRCFDDAHIIRFIVIVSIANFAEYRSNIVVGFVNKFYN